MRTTTYNNMMRDFANLTDAMNRSFTGYDFVRNGGRAEANPSDGATRLPLDIWAGDEAYTITAYLPGVKPEDVTITFEGEELSIRGQFPQTPENTQFIKQELFHGAFERRLGFNVPVNADNIEAGYENGLLTLVVPKAEAVKPKQIKVVVK